LATEPPDSHKNDRTLAIPALVCSSVLLIGLRACVPTEHVQYNGHSDLVAIKLLAPWASRAIAWGSVLGLILVLLAAVLLRRSGRGRSAVVLVLLGGMGFAASWIFFAVSNLAPWTYYDTIPGPGGRLFSFLDSSFLQGQTMALTCRSDQGLFYVTEEVLGTNNGDSPRSWATVIRPVGSSDQRYGQLFCTPAGWLLGIRYEEHCYLAYHLPSGPSFGHGDVENLSPFLLLEDGAKPNPADVDRLVKRLSEEKTGPGCPSGAVLQAGLASTSPDIRGLAQRLLSVVSESQHGGSERSNSPAATTGE
jgi:hypothetical protein